MKQWKERLQAKCSNLSQTTKSLGESLSPPTPMLWEWQNLSGSMVT